ncbi:hypothetical protein V2J56_08165 [Georgenia sp. MJ206]|uniref:hypothetical protein n=1 Tax=Georgenia wangjunii TaxID=3117730 RepID=UPI002F26069F
MTLDFVGVAAVLLAIPGAIVAWRTLFKERAQREREAPRWAALGLVAAGGLGFIGAAAIIAGVAGVFDPTLAATPNPVTPGQRLNVCGSGFEPYALVDARFELSFDERLSPEFDQPHIELGAGQITGDGSFCIEGRLSENAPAGNRRLAILEYRGDSTSYHYVALNVLEP